MARLRSQHRELTDGVGKCSKPMWDGFGMPAGFCDRPAYGLQQKKSLAYLNKVYVPSLACPGHGGPPEPEPVAQPEGS